MARVDAIVIGAGVTGAAIAYEFASCGIDVLVLESAPGSAAGASGANAGIIDTGYSGAPGSFETSMVLAHGRRWRAIFDELAIPYQLCGAVLIAQDSEQAARLPDIERIAKDNGVKVKAFDRGQIRQFEPQAKAAGGLLIPDDAITDPYEMVSHLLAAGPKVSYSTPVRAVEPLEDGALVRCEADDLETRFVVNCAGLFADAIAADDSFSVAAQRGEFIVFPQEAAMLTDHIVFSVPPRSGAAATIFPTIYGHLCAVATTGPEVDKSDWKTSATGIDLVRAAAAMLIPKLADLKPIDAWAGLRAVARPHGYVLEWSKRVPRMYSVAGIDAAGISAAFGLSAYVLDRCRERGLEVKGRSPRPARASEPTFPWWQRRKR